MNVKELREILQTEKIDPRCYSLDESAPVLMEVVYCIRKGISGYEVSINERGKYEDKECFFDEHSACVDFLKLVAKYMDKKLKKYLPAE